MDEKTQPVYEWKSMSEWYEENRINKNTKKNPLDDRWEFVAGALRRIVKND